MYPPHNGAVKGSPEAQEPAAELRPSSREHHKGWTVRSSSGSARRFHALDPDPTTGHEVWVHHLDRPAVVFGSTQVPGRFGGDGAMTDSTDTRIEVCTRRSGGGLVVVRPDDVWIDVVVPRRSALHSDDVGLAFRWFGQVWVEALRPIISDAGLDGPDLRLAEPPPARRASDRPFFCFADIGHGEVLHGDRKVVGISQRRTRTWTRLQSLLVVDWNPAEIDDLVGAAIDLAGVSGLQPADLGRPPHDAVDVKAGFRVEDQPLEIEAANIVQAVLRRLPVVDGGARPDRFVNRPR